MRSQAGDGARYERAGSARSAMHGVPDDGRSCKCTGCAARIAASRSRKCRSCRARRRFSKRFEDAVGQACESAAARQVALRFGLPASTVRVDRFALSGAVGGDAKKPALAQMGVDEIHLGKKQKFITVVSNLDSGRAGLVRPRAQEGNPGWVFPERVERRAADADRGGLRGHVGTISV